MKLRRALVLVTFECSLDYRTFRWLGEKRKRAKLNERQVLGKAETMQRQADEDELGLSSVALAALKEFALENNLLGGCRDVLLAEEHCRPQRVFTLSRPVSTYIRLARSKMRHTAVCNVLQIYILCS